MSLRGTLKKAFAAFQQGDYSTAEEHCLSAINLDSTSYDAHLLLGKCAFRVDNTEKAEEYYSKATELNPDALPAWQGLTELFENSSMDSAKAIVPLQRIVTLLKDDKGKLIPIQIRLSNVFKGLNRREEAEGILQKVLEEELGLNEDQRLQILCLLADLQLLDYEKSINDRLEAAFEGLRCGLEYKPECEHDALLNRVTGDFAEEALEADRKLGTTLKSIIQLTPPCGHYKKFHDFYLQLFTKAMYCTPPRSIQRYNLRLQTLETCYKLIHNQLSSTKGLCTTPFPFVTALRLLEINDDIVGGRRAVGGQNVEGVIQSPREKSFPSMFKSESDPALHLLPPSSPLSPTSSIRISLTHKMTTLETKNQPILTNKSSLERRRSLDGGRASFRLLSTSPKSSHSGLTSHSPPGLMPPLLETPEPHLPNFLRSSSLSCVRKLHRLGSGFLQGMEDIVGGNSPLVTEISDSIGRKLARLMPWHIESKIQMILAIERNRRNPKNKIFDIDSTDLGSLAEAKMTPEVASKHIEMLNQSVVSGTRLLSPRIGLVDLLMEQDQPLKALEACEEALEWILCQTKKGGYPRTQASLTFHLQKATALLKLKRLEESEIEFQSLMESVSEGEVSFGALVGCQSVSIHQAALRGLALVALARNDRPLALRQYEQMMGAGLLGKSPIEHWAAAEYGFMLYEDSDTVRAKQYLEKSLQILNSIPPPVGVDSIRAEYHFKLALVYWKLGSKWKTDRQFACRSLQTAALHKGPFQASALTLLGQYYSEVEEDFVRGQECWEKALELDPEQETAGMALFQLLKEQNYSFVDLKAFCVKYITLSANRMGSKSSWMGSKSFWMYDCQGELCLQQGLYQSAITSFQKVLKTKNQNPVLWEKLGTAHFKSNRMSSAQKCFARALELDSNRVYALVKLGDCKFQLEDFRGALEAYREAWKLDSESPVVINSLVSCLLKSSKIQYNSGSLGLSAEYIQDAKKLLEDFSKKHDFPQVFYKLEADVRYWSTQIHDIEALTQMQQINDPTSFISMIETSQRRQENDLEQAKLLYGKLLRLYPNYAQFWGDFTLRGVHQSIQDPILARKLILGGLKIDSSASELWFLLGRLSVTPHEKEYAFSRALQLESSHVRSWVELARLYKKHDQLQLTKEALNQARSHDSSNALIWEVMGEVEEADFDQSKNYLLHSMDLQGSKTCYLTCALKVIKNWSQGLNQDFKNILQRCLYLYPLNPTIWNGYGLMKEQEGNLQKALFSFEMSLALLEKMKEDRDCIGQVKMNLGRLYLKLNQPQRVKDALQDVCDLRGHYLLAAAAYEVGALEEAESHLKQVLKQEKEVEGILEAVTLLVKVTVTKTGCLEALKLLDTETTRLKEKLSKTQGHQLMKTWSSLLNNTQTEEEFDIIRSKIMELGIEQGLHIKAKVNFANYTKMHNREDLLKAVHCYPWNQDYQLSLNLDTLQDQLSSHKEKTFWTKQMLIPLLDPNQDPILATNLWISNLRIYKESMSDRKVQCEELERVTMKSIRLCPQSIILWFTLTLLDAKLSLWTRAEDPCEDQDSTRWITKTTLKLLDSIKEKSEIATCMLVFLKRMEE